jgi:hypothetical protein
MPDTGSITARMFRDSNQSGFKDDGEAVLSGWTMALYFGSNCTDVVLGMGVTNANGERVFSDLAAGKYSVREMPRPGWTSTTSSCQNEALLAGENAVLDFGSIEESVQLWGDVDCDGDVDSVDSLKIQRHITGFFVSQTEPCPDIGSEVAFLFGDVDCDGDVDSVDSLKIQRHITGMKVRQTEPCSDIGSPP